MQNPTLVGWSIALADVGRLIGATGLIFFPSFLHKQYYLQCIIGALGCLVGLCVSFCEPNGTPQVAFWLDFVKLQFVKLFMCLFR